jgi:hypothetical protein
MRTILGGRPALNIPSENIVEAVRQHRQVVAAARALGCSPAYIHKRLKASNLTLAQVLGVTSVESPYHG